jgi:hypothetical protein
MSLPSILRGYMFHWWAGLARFLVEVLSIRAFRNSVVIPELSSSSKFWQEQFYDVFE